MGSKDDHLGEKAHWKDVSSDIRRRPRVCSMVPGSFRKPARGHSRFPELCHHASTPPDHGQSGQQHVTGWQVIPTNRLQSRYQPKKNIQVSNGEEARWLKEVFKIIQNGNNKCSQLDLLEVYAYPNSKLTETAKKCGLRAERFTKEDGDLSTDEGRNSLLTIILLRRPKHVWLSPECKPWSAWNQFNSQRSLWGYQQVSRQQEDSRVHLRLCNLVFKLQQADERHTHMESPWTAKTWDQPEIQDLMRGTIAARIDQCQFGLQNPKNNMPLEKKTRIQTTSKSLFHELDQRICHHEHEHSQIAGTCQWKGASLNVSKFAAMYPSALAKAIVKGILKEKSTPMEVPTYHVTDLEEPPTKRVKHNPPEDEDNSKDVDMTDNKPSEDSTLWKPVFEHLKTELPKSGVQTWTNPMSQIFQAVRKLLPQYSIGAIRAGKGLDRYISGEQGWADELPCRHTILMQRFSHQIIDLWLEDCSSLTKQQIHRHAKPSHIMLCVFAEKSIRDQNSGVQSSDDPAAVPPDPTVREPSLSGITNPVPTWTPLSASVSGPKFQDLTDENKGIVRKLHINLGHPTSEKLARHLAEANAQRHLVDGAKDYLCGSCAERQRPSLTTPGNLKDAKEFNERVSIDGFDWKGKQGQNYYVIHILDEATRFHLGLRTQRNIQSTLRTLHNLWFQWAGYPQQIAHDQGGEFMTDGWKNLLLENGIQSILSAAPWQRGRIERHGAVIKDMLDRIDNDQTITDAQHFDEALVQCFRAKNTMSVVDGYSPEQAVLGRASKLPASIVSDETATAHLNSQGAEDLSSSRFQRQLELRSAARAAFAKADNNQALRRALLRQSRGVSHTWACGQLCMYWDKRRSPNMLEKGRWNGPAQVVCQESRTIIWITHLNRLLRCARENLRPVSMREFQQHSTFAQTSTSDQLAQMSKQLQNKLKERSGLFQYLDLSEIGPSTAPDDDNPSQDNPTENNSQGQPEEEPYRKLPLNIDPKNVDLDAMRLHQAQETPVPESPISSIPAGTANEGAQGENSDACETVECETDQESTKTDPNMEPVYNVELMENTSHSDVIIEDEGTVWPDQDPFEHACTTFSFEVPRQQLTRYVSKPVEYLPCLIAAAKKGKNKVQYSHLNAAEKQLFDQAKQKELKCWLDTNTVQAIMRNRIHPSRIMSSRWILTWKDDPTQQNGRKAKARLVVKGFQDPDISTLNSDSPTLTRDSRMLLLQTVSSMNWVIQSFDITTAFLRGRSDERQLAMEAPPELRSLMRMDMEQVCLLKGNAYGRVDAPLLFYKEFRKRLEEVGFQAHPLDNCLFLLRDPRDPHKLDGILGTHVDDGIGGGNKNFEIALEKLQKTLPFGSREHGKFKLTGLDIEQLPDFPIKVNQGKYVNRIAPIDVPKIRRAEPESTITPQELHQLRGLCGSLQYAAVHSRPDIATRVAHIQKSIPKATVDTLLEGNRTLKEAQNFCDTSVIVRPIPISEVSFASFGDASFASAKQLSANKVCLSWHILRSWHPTRPLSFHP